MSVLLWALVQLCQPGLSSSHGAVSPQMQRGPSALLCWVGTAVTCCSSTCLQCLCKRSLYFASFVRISLAVWVSRMSQDYTCPWSVSQLLWSMKIQHPLTGFEEDSVFFLLWALSDMMFFYLSSETLLAFLLTFWGWAGHRHHYQLISFCCSFSLLSHSVVVIHITLVMLCPVPPPLFF